MKRSGKVAKWQSGRVVDCRSSEWQPLVERLRGRRELLHFATSPLCHSTTSFKGFRP